MNKNILIHSAIFIILHFFGALPIIIDIATTQGGSALSSAPIEQVIKSQAVYSILQYILLAILSCLIFVFSHYKLAHWIATHPCNSISPTLTHLTWAILSTLSLLIINISFFKASVFYIPEHLMADGLNIGHMICALIVISPYILFIHTLWINHNKIFYALCSIGLISTAYPYLTSTPQTYRADKPNIIFIGIDSLRLELINQYMPTLSEQLASSTVFENSYTPIARTYPAWMSILTGRHPANSNARYNLQPESMLSTDNHYLAGTLKGLGYQSIYASDERRFSNIGSAQGFDYIIGPNTGAADFILGEYADFPLLNLLTQLPIAKWLMPEIYSNRAASHLYTPKQFSDLLTSELSNIEDSPLFLAVHFCLPHWPFTFVGHKNLTDYTEKPAYPDNLRAVDQQIATLLQQLNEQGLLNNSKLVFLSDHGESWGSVDTGFNNLKGEPLVVSDHGHGMNILSPDSHKVLMALKGFDLPIAKSKRLSSLMDISPTITESLDIPSLPLRYDGHSLTSPAPPQKEISFESGLVLAEANKAIPDSDKVAQAGQHNYHILKTGLLRLKEESTNKLLPQKQLGLRQNQMGLFRSRFIGHQMSYLLVNYQTLQYQQLTHLTDAHRLHPSLVKSFCRLFSSSQTQISKECVSL